MSTIETWGFGLTGHILWIAVIPAIHAELKSQAIFVWVPAVCFGMLLNYQVKHLGRSWQNVAGGTPNYACRLLKQYPGLALYAALGYFFSWVSVLPVNAIVLTDLIKVNLEAVNLTLPTPLLSIALTLLPFILAFSGTRGLSILHLFFVIPAVGLLLLFTGQGLGWLLFSPNSPGLFPEQMTVPGFADWAKWFLYVSYATYACETASAFVADSIHPTKTLSFLSIASWLMIPIYIGASWVETRLGTSINTDNGAFLSLLVSSQHFWGKYAGLLVTFLLAASCLLASATVVSNCPRILYQLAVDKYLSSVFAVVSRRGVFGPALTLTLILSLACLIWGNVPQILVVGNLGWFISIMAVHLGICLRSDKPQVLFPRLTLVLFLLEISVLLIGGIAWGWQDFLIGLFVPVGIIAIDQLIRRLRLPLFNANWWVQKYNYRPWINVHESLIYQVITLISLLSSAVVIGWLFGRKFNTLYDQGTENLIVVLLMIVVFVGVAIACWTSLPQVVSMAEAQSAAEHLFNFAQDGILVVDEEGIIRQANAATTSFFGIQSSDLLGTCLQIWLVDLDPYPFNWPTRSEHTIIQISHVKTVEVSVSDQPHQDFQEYIVILHDITQRKQAEELLINSEAELKHKAQKLAAQLVQSEKMSSLGQLVAGVAHEINNPVSFIYGNLDPADEYIRDLIRLINLYQHHYPQPVREITNLAEEIDLNYMLNDLPKLLNSIKMGSQRIKDIVLSLRNFSRLDEAEIKLVNLHEGIESTLLILQNRLKANNKRPALTVIKKYAELPLIECYPGQLNQVFMNLLVNAIDALDDAFVNHKKHQEPQINIQTTITTDHQVCITITDNGRGIPEDSQKHLFEPFFTTKPVGKGTGLGLSISYQIIAEKHDGSLECFSEVGQGTKFVITIPLQQKKSNSKFQNQLSDKLYVKPAAYQKSTVPLQDVQN
ncbi:amino acid permease [Sphaerospermopsis aphanizomenoides BCCUSP55]|nr:amino acid permease [Sphaerospermopsis aphanizomenoides BCCUSP55]